MMNAINDRRQKYWHPSWIEPDVNYRHIRIDHTMRALTLARELGARCITTEPGGPVEPGGSWQAALKLFVEMLKPVIAHAGEGGRAAPDRAGSRAILVETADQALETDAAFRLRRRGAQFRHRPLLTAARTTPRHSTAVGKVQRAIITWKTSPHRGCTIIWCPARGPSISMRP